MESPSLVVRGQRVLLPDGERPAAIDVRHGRIVAIRDAAGLGPTGAPEIDAGDLVVLPGLVDTHVHINDPGRADWEGFEHATRAAAAGGVTTLVDMPLNSIPPTTTVEGLGAKREAAAGRCHVDVGFWGGVVPGNAADLEPLARAGVLGFKCFLSPSGVDEFGAVSEDDLLDALPVLSRLGLPLLVHAELPAGLRVPAGDVRRYRTWLDSRPPAAECAAIDLMIRLSQAHRVRVHVVHLAASDALPALAAARAAGAAVSVETCPHYLTFDADAIADGATPFKCAPPIRGVSDRDRLWHALEDGTIDLVATDHSPSPPSLKRLDDGDFVRAWGGIASLQIGLSAVWTGAARRGLPIARLAEWMAAAPARVAGLDRAKGRIAVGCDADFAIFDPDETWTVAGRDLFHRHPVTPYDGMRVRGRVRTTVLRGKVVFDDRAVAGEPRGQLLGSRVR